MKTFLQELKDTLLIVLGILSAGMGLKGFLFSSRFIDGSVTGISMLVSDIFGLPLAILILVINLPFIALGYRQIGKKFAIKNSLAIGGLSLCLAFIKYPDVTRLEISKIKNIIGDIDETAFTVIHHIADVSGGMVKKRLLH